MTSAAAKMPPANALCMIMKFASLLSAGIDFVMGESSTSRRPVPIEKMMVPMTNTTISLSGAIQGAQANRTNPTTMTTWDPMQKGL